MDSYETGAPERWLAQMPTAAVREQLGTAFGVEIEGRPWVVATDSRTLIAERTQQAPPPHDQPEVTRRVLDYLTIKGDTIGVASLHDLRNFAGAVEWPTARECTVCEGTGKVDAEHVCDCDYCDLAMEPDELDNCSACRAGTVLTESNRRPGWVGPVAIDRVLLARALSVVDVPTPAAVKLASFHVEAVPCLLLDVVSVRMVVVGILMQDSTLPEMPRLGVSVYA